MLNVITLHCCNGSYTKISLRDVLIKKFNAKDLFELLIPV